MKISVVSGGFDPVHSGHIDYIEKASSLGDKLVILLNSDDWLTSKKGKPFMSFIERKRILESMRCVDEVVEFDDSDGSCKKGLLYLLEIYNDDEIIFCNGGDRNQRNIPELNIKNIKYIFGVGGSNKLNSSSKILNNWNFNQEERVWGKFLTLFQKNTIKVKELIIDSSKGMSFQRHNHRMEVWFVHSGRCKVYFQDKESSATEIILNPGDLFKVPIGALHQITNPFTESCKMVEIQYGSAVNESDIERLFYFPKIPNINESYNN